MVVAVEILAELVGRTELLAGILAEILVEVLAEVLVEIFKVKASLVVYCLGFSVS